MRSLEIVTADGSLLSASPTELPDLFWGVKTTFDPTNLLRVNHNIPPV